MPRSNPPRRDERPAAPSCRASSLAITLLLASLLAAPAQASPDTLRRSFSNMIGGPFDMLLSPFSGGLTLAKNIQDIEDTTAVRLVYALPGWVWLTGLNFGSGAIRAVTGVLEVAPGVLLFPFERDLDPLFDPVDDAGALIDLENPLVWIENPWVYYDPLITPLAIRAKWGINYTRAEF